MVYEPSHTDIVCVRTVVIKTVTIAFKILSELSWL